MTVFSAHHADPMFCFMGRPRRIFHPWVRRMRSSCASPCSPCSFPLLKLLLFAAFFPLLARGFFFVIQLALHCVIPIAMVVLITACSCSNGEHSPSAAFKKRLCGTSKEHEEHSKAAKNDEKPRRRVDLSSVYVVEPLGEENLAVVVAAPGVRNEDLDVSVVENVCTVKGESTKGSDVFRVERRIVLPQGMYDGETASATHSDGTLTLVFKKRAAKRVPVTVEAARGVGKAPRAAPLAEDTFEHQEVKMTTEDAHKSEDDWESLEGEKQKEQ